MIKPHPLINYYKKIDQSACYKKSVDSSSSDVRIYKNVSPIFVKSFTEVRYFFSSICKNGT